MGQSRRDEASSPHGHASLSPARQCMQGASPAPYVLQSFLRFHLGDSSHLAPAPTCHIVIVCIFLLITMRNSLIQLPHRLLVYNVVTVIRVNLTAEEIRQNCCYAPGTEMRHPGLIRYQLNFLPWLISSSAERCGIHWQECGSFSSCFVAMGLMRWQR